MNFRLYPILIDLIISHIYDWLFIGDPTQLQRILSIGICFRGAFVHHFHTSYVWLKITTVSESTLVTNANKDNKKCLRWFFVLYTLTLKWLFLFMVSSIFFDSLGTCREFIGSLGRSSIFFSSLGTCREFIGSLGRSSIPS